MSLELGMIDQTDRPAHRLAPLRLGVTWRAARGRASGAHHQEGREAEQSVAEVASVLASPSLTWAGELEGTGKGYFAKDSYGSHEGKRTASGGACAATGALGEQGFTRFIDGYSATGRCRAMGSVVSMRTDGLVCGAP